MRWNVAAFLVVFAAGAAHAEEGYCIGPLNLGEANPLRLMRVVSTAPHVNFYESKSDKKKQCPAELDSCRRKGFLLPGDEVLAGPKQRDFACVSFISPAAKQVKGKFTETNGFMQTSALVEVPLAPQLKDWVGTWTRAEEGAITIALAPNGKLKVDGEASFGALDPERVKRGAVNQGQLEGEGTPKGNMLSLGAGYDGTKPLETDMGSECKARLRLYGRYLAVEDNLGCGGMNVSFIGVYVKLK